MWTDRAIVIFAFVQAVFTFFLVFIYVRKQTNIMKVQKVINARQVILAEIANNFYVWVENDRDKEKLLEEADKPGNMEKIAEIDQYLERLRARNSKLTNELNQLPPIT